MSGLAEELEEARLEIARLRKAMSKGWSLAQYEYAAEHDYLPKVDQ